jgi:hypothetical protein
VIQIGTCGPGVGKCWGSGCDKKRIMSYEAMIGAGSFGFGSSLYFLFFRFSWLLLDFPCHLCSAQQLTPWVGRLIPRYPSMDSYRVSFPSEID